MTGMDFRPAQTRTTATVRAARRTVPGGAERCYLRFAVLGDGGRPWALAPAGRGWPQLLGDAMAAIHDVSRCDVSEAGATSFDVRRAQLRVALAHRPQVVALVAGSSDLGRRDWDADEVGAHLTHCARLLTQRGAVLLTTTSGARWHRARAAQLDAVYAELADRFGTVHLDRAASAQATAARFAVALAGRGLELSR